MLGPITNNYSLIFYELKLYSVFAEREENVKSDIFHAYMALLRQTRRLLAVPVDPDGMEAEEGPVSMLQMQVPNIVRAVHRQMREKSIKTRQDCLTLLRELVAVLPGALATHVPALIPGILYSLGYGHGIYLPHIYACQNNLEISMSNAVNLKVIG